MVELDLECLDEVAVYRHRRRIKTGQMLGGEAFPTEA